MNMPSVAGKQAADPVEPKQAGKHERYDFLPALLEIQERPPHPASRVGIGLIVAVVLSGVIWAAIGRIDIIAVTQGVLSPRGQTKLVQAAETGSVAEIGVVDGQTVAAGEELVRLDDTEADAAVRALEDERIELELRIARLEATLDGLEGEAPAAFVADVGTAAQRAAQRRKLDAFFDHHRAEHNGLRNELSAQRFALAQTEAQVTKLNAVRPLIEERASGLKSLMERDLGARTQWLELEQEAVETRSDLAIAEQRAGEIKAGIDRLQTQLAVHDGKARRLLLDDLAEARQRLDQLRHERTRAGKRIDRHVVRAPIAGSVQQLAVHTVGGVVQAGQELLRIVPTDYALEARVEVQNKDIGFIREGQLAEVKVDAYPFTKYGVVTATVERVSGDAEPNEQFGYVFGATLALDTESLRVNGRDVRLSPGMTISAEIKTGERRLIEFLLAPLMQNLDEGLRER